MVHLGKSISWDPPQNTESHLLCSTGVTHNEVLDKFWTSWDGNAGAQTESLDRLCFEFIVSPKKVGGCRGGNRYEKKGFENLFEKAIN